MTTLREQFIAWAANKHNKNLQISMELYRWSASGKLPVELAQYYAGISSTLAEKRLHRAIERRTV